MPQLQGGDTPELEAGPNPPREGGEGGETDTWSVIPRKRPTSDFDVDLNLEEP